MLLSAQSQINELKTRESELLDTIATLKSMVCLTRSQRIVPYKPFEPIVDRVQIPAPGSELQRLRVAKITAQSNSYGIWGLEIELNDGQCQEIGAFWHQMCMNSQSYVPGDICKIEV